MIAQDPFLFSATVRENIAFGRPDATDEDVEQAARLAQAHEFIEALPDGYDTVIGERGITLSGGQRQRIAIARALVVDPRILILDDATASVDATTEAQIRNGLREAMRGRTTIIIAHRLSTIALADEIVVLEDGRVPRADDTTSSSRRARVPRDPRARDARARLQRGGRVRVHQPGSHLMRGGRSRRSTTGRGRGRGAGCATLYRSRGRTRPHGCSRSSRCSARRRWRSCRRTSSGARSTRCSTDDTGCSAGSSPRSSRRACSGSRSATRRRTSRAGPASACSPTSATTLFRHLQRLSLGFYERNRAGVIISRLTNDVEALDQLVTDGVTSLVQNTLTLARLRGGALLPRLAARARDADGRARRWRSRRRWFRKRSGRAYRAVRETLGARHRDARRGHRRHARAAVVHARARGAARTSGRSATTTASRTCRRSS